MMTEKDHVRRKRFLPPVETLLIIGLCIKLTLTAGFFLLSLDPGGLPFQPAVAHAADKAKETPPPDDGQPADTPETPAAAPAESAESVLASQYKGMIAALKSREDDLNRRGQNLEERKKALDALEKELDQRMAAIEETRKKLEDLVQKQEQLVNEQKVLKDARIEHLVTAYKGMRPEQAGKLVDSLDDEVAVEILAAMPGRNAGQILAYVEPQKAARLTKAISERKLPETPQSGALQPQTAK